MPHTWRCVWQQLLLCALFALVGPVTADDSSVPLGTRLLRFRDALALSHAKAASSVRRAVHRKAYDAQRAKDDMDNPFFGSESTYATWVLTNNPSQNPFRSLTPYGNVNPYNPLSTLIPPIRDPGSAKEALTVDYLMTNARMPYARKEIGNIEDVRYAPTPPYGVAERMHVPKNDYDLSPKLDADAFLEVDSKQPGSGSGQDANMQPWSNPGGGGNLYNAFYGGGGKGPTWVFPHANVGWEKFKYRYPSTESNLDKTETDWSLKTRIRTPPMGVAYAERVPANRRYMPLFDRPSSPGGVGAFAFLQEAESIAPSEDGAHRAGSSRSRPHLEVSEIEEAERIASAQNAAEEEHYREVFARWQSRLQSRVGSGRYPQWAAARVEAALRAQYAAPSADYRHAEVSP